MKVTERWYSHRMHRDITLVRWGHYGVPVLLFPTAGGDAEEVERNQLIGHLTPLIEAGRVKVYSCDSVAGMALVRREGSPEHRMWLFNQFHDTVAHEVVPAIHADVHGPRPIIAAGSSIGSSAGSLSHPTASSVPAIRRARRSLSCRLKSSIEARERRGGWDEVTGVRGFAYFTEL